MKETFYQLIKEVSYSCTGILALLLSSGIALAHDADPQKAESIYKVAIEANYKKALLSEVFTDIESKTEFVFTFDHNDPFLQDRFSKRAGITTVAEVLEEVSISSILIFLQINNNISVKKQKAEERIITPAVIVNEAITVTGQVTSSSDTEGIPGVNILVKGTGAGTVTDIDGSYDINVPQASETLVFSSIGYKKQEIPVNGRTVINVLLEEDLQGLDEVVVMAFGEEQGKREMVGSVTTMSTAELRMPSSNLTTALAGGAAGVMR